MRPIDVDLAIEQVKGSDLTNREKVELVLFLSSVPTIAPPPNDPLTLEQLREMDGEPVWITREDGEDCWTLIRYCNFCGIGTYGCGFLTFDNYSITWLAYRRRPEEGS